MSKREGEQEGLFVTHQQTGDPLGGGTIPAVEGNTWIGRPAKPDGVYETTKTLVAKCAFIRLS